MHWGVQTTCYRHIIGRQHRRHTFIPSITVRGWATPRFPMREPLARLEQATTLHVDRTEWNGQYLLIWDPEVLPLYEIPESCWGGWWAGLARIWCAGPRRGSHRAQVPLGGNGFTSDLFEQ